MYQDNLEKTNQISQQLREALGENEEINVEVERTHNISGIYFELFTCVRI